MRWIKALDGVRALSVRQPWAWLIVNGYKDVENRSWRTHYRGPVLIHAGANTSELSEPTIQRIEHRHGIKLPREFETGGIIGVVDIVDCRSRTGSTWHVRGNIGWVLAKPRRLTFRACKGALGFFKPEF
jgi:hypothetical protein